LIGELVYESKYKMKEFVHLGSWVGGDFRTIFVAKDSPFKDFKQVIEESKKRKINVGGGGGLGSTSQLQTVYLKELVKLNLNFVPFDSDAEVVAAVLGKHVDIGTGPLSGALRVYRSGDTRILVVHSRNASKRSKPDHERIGIRRVVIPTAGLGSA
jgi:tripartite-type tricarboxylate transporter receptor subunit TctC